MRMAGISRQAVQYHRRENVDYTRKRTTMRLSLVTLITLGAGSMMVRADVIQSTVVLPPPAGQYTVPEICISTGCTVNAVLDLCARIAELLDLIRKADAILMAAIADPLTKAALRRRR